LDQMPERSGWRQQLKELQRIAGAALAAVVLSVAAAIGGAAIVRQQGGPPLESLEAWGFFRSGRAPAAQPVSPPVKNPAEEAAPVGAAPESQAAKTDIERRRAQEDGAAAVLPARPPRPEAAREYLAALLARPVLSGFGWREHPVYRDWRLHTGVDIEFAAGEAVRAVAAGTVREVREDGALGLTVVVADGENTISYASLSRSDVKPGAAIQPGQVLGAAGTAPGEPYFHLHLEVRRGKVLVDPGRLLEK